jgi:hypothetical protein
MGTNQDSRFGSYPAHPIEVNPSSSTAAPTMKELTDPLAQAEAVREPLAG